MTTLALSNPANAVGKPARALDALRGVGLIGHAASVFF